MPITKTAAPNLTRDEEIQNIEFLLRQLGKRQGFFTDRSRRNALAILVGLSERRSFSSFVAQVETQYRSISRQSDSYFGLRGKAGSSFLKITGAFLEKHATNITLDVLHLDGYKHKQLLAQLILQHRMQGKQKIRRQDTFTIQLDGKTYSLTINFSIYLTQGKENNVNCYVVDHNNPANGAFGKVLPVTKKWRFNSRTRHLIQTQLKQPLVVKIILTKDPKNHTRLDMNDQRKKRDFELSNVELRNERNKMSALFQVDDPEDHQLLYLPWGDTEKGRLFMLRIGNTSLSDIDLKSLAYSDAINIALSLCQFMVDMHDVKHMTHCDLKPKNIRVDTKTMKARPIDYAFTREIGIDRANNGGSSEYMPAEIWSGFQESDDTPRDIYALSLILFQLLYAKSWEKYHKKCLGNIPECEKKAYADIQNNLCSYELSECAAEKRPLLALILNGLSDDARNRPKAKDFVQVLRLQPQERHIQLPAFLCRLLS